MSARDTESTNLLSPVLNILVGEFVVVERLQVVDRRLVERQLVGRVLRILGKFELGVSRHCSLAGLQSASDQVEQGGFTGTVITDNGNSAGQSSQMTQNGQRTASPCPHQSRGSCTGSPSSHPSTKRQRR